MKQWYALYVLLYSYCKGDTYVRRYVLGNATTPFAKKSMVV